MAMDIATQDEAARLLREGARLLYTVAAGQAFELGDINAWFEQYNTLVGSLGEGFRDEHYGVIVERTSDTDPLVDQAQDILADLVRRVSTARDDYVAAALSVRQGGGA